MRRLTDRDERLAVARRIRLAREASGFRNADLARLLLVAPGRISSWENGDALPNTPRLWRLLADALGVSADYILFGRTDGLSRAVYAKLAALVDHDPNMNGPS